MDMKRNLRRKTTHLWFMFLIVTILFAGQGQNYAYANDDANEDALQSSEGNNLLPENPELSIVNGGDWSVLGHSVTRSSLEGENYAMLGIPEENIVDNYTFKGKFTINEIGSEGYYGPRIIFRYENDESYLAIMFSQDSAGTGYLLERNPSGNYGWVELATFYYPTTKGVAYNFEIESAPEQVVLQVNGRVILEKSVPKHAMGVGLYSAGAKITFEKLGVYGRTQGLNLLPENPELSIVNGGDWSVQGHSVTRSSLEGENYAILGIPDENIVDSYTFKGKFTINEIGSEGYYGPRIIFRYENDESYLAIMFSQDSSGTGYLLERNPSGNYGWVELATFYYPTTKGVAYNFEIESAPEQVVLQVNGRVILEKSVPKHAMGVGLYSAGAKVTFEQLGVYEVISSEQPVSDPFPVPETTVDLGSGTYYGENDKSVIFGNRMLEIGVRKSNRAVSRLLDKTTGEQWVWDKNNLPASKVFLDEYGYNGKSTFLELETEALGEDQMRIKLNWEINGLKLTDIFELQRSGTVLQSATFQNIDIEPMKFRAVKFSPLTLTVPEGEQSMRTWRANASAIMYNPNTQRGIGVFYYANGDEYTSELLSEPYVRLGYTSLAEGKLQPHQNEENVGTIAYRLLQGNEREMKASMQGVYLDAGLKVPELPEWEKGGVMYEIFPLGHIFDDFRGGLTLSQWNATRNWTNLEKMGINMVWMMPPYQEESFIPYGVLDYFKVDPALGSDEDYHQFVKKAHDSGISVIQDMVPHGGHPINPIPEWGRYNENGDRYRIYGETYDYANRDWQAYQQEVARYWTEKFDIDGFRVDVAYWDAFGPNWNSDRRASFSVLGGSVEIMEAMRKGFIEGKNNATALPLIMPESNDEPALFGASNMSYGWRLLSTIRDGMKAESNADPAVVSLNIKQLLDDEKYALPYGVSKLRFLANHDEAKARGGSNKDVYGSERLRALYAMHGLIDGVPLYYQGDEVGYESFLAKLHRIRKEVPEIRAGESFYNEDEVRATGGVFSFARKLNQKSSVVLVNLNSTSVTTNVDVQTELLELDGLKTYDVINIWNGETVLCNTSKEKLAHFKFDLGAYEPAVLVIREHGHPLDFREDLHVAPDVEAIQYSIIPGQHIPSKINIRGDAEITKPIEKESLETRKYEAEVLDQDGQVMQDVKVRWSVTEAEGVSIETETGLLTVTDQATAGPITIKAMLAGDAAIYAEFKLTLRAIGDWGDGRGGRTFSSNADLTDLQVWASDQKLKLTPSFASGKTDYAALTEAKQIEIVVKAAHSAAKVMLKDKVFTNGIKVDLEEGDNTFVLTVQAENGTKKNYILTVYREISKETKPIIEFTDITGYWSESLIKLAAAKGIISGYTDGTFKPNNPVTRAEFTVMLAGLLKLEGDGAVITFTDNDQIGAWAKDAVAQAVQAGIVNGYNDGSFRPNAHITRSEMAVMIARSLKLQLNAHVSTNFADDETIPPWAKGAIEAIRDLGITDGRGNNRFVPHIKATRAEATVMLLRTLEHKFPDN